MIDAGQPRAAVEKLSAAPADDPRVAALLGVAYYHANDAGHAIEILEPVLAKLPPDSAERREAVQVLGLSHYLAGHIAEAIPFLEATRAAVPDDIKLAYALAMAYAQTRQPAKARESIERTFHVAPDSAAAHLLTGQTDEPARARGPRRGGAPRDAASRSKDCPRPTTCWGRSRSSDRVSTKGSR